MNSLSKEGGGILLCYAFSCLRMRGHFQQLEDLPRIQYKELRRVIFSVSHKRSVTNDSLHMSFSLYKYSD